MKGGDSLMKQGLLWFDNDPKRSLEEKIAQAAERYYQKFGHRPNTCFVNPQMFPGQEVRPATGVRVVSAHDVLPHHLWLGVATSDSLDTKKRAS